MMAEAKEEVDDGEGEEMGAVAWDQRNWYWCGGPAGVHDEPVENLDDSEIHDDDENHHIENHHNEKLEEKLIDEIYDENHHNEKLVEKILDVIPQSEKLEEKLDENHNHMYWVEIDQHLVEETAIRPLHHVEMINLQLEDDHHLHGEEQDQEE
jgi:hypothetical protein